MSQHRHKTRRSPGDVPDAGVNHDQVWFQTTPDVLQNALHILREDPGDKIEADMVVVWPIVTHLPITSRVGHWPSLQQAVVFKLHLPLWRGRRGGGEGSWWGIGWGREGGGWGGEGGREGGWGVWWGKQTSNQMMWIPLQTRTNSQMHLIWLTPCEEMISLKDTESIQTNLIYLLIHVQYGHHYFASILLGMEFTRDSQGATGVLFHSSMTTSQSWWMLETLRSSTFRLWMPHRCSIGFRSGDMLGQSITYWASVGHVWLCVQLFWGDSKLTLLYKLYIHYGAHLWPC